MQFGNSNTSLPIADAAVRSKALLVDIPIQRVGIRGDRRFVLLEAYVECCKANGRRADSTGQPRQSFRFCLTLGDLTTRNL